MCVYLSHQDPNVYVCKGVSEIQCVCVLVCMNVHACVCMIICDPSFTISIFIILM